MPPRIALSKATKKPGILVKSRFSESRVQSSNTGFFVAFESAILGGMQKILYISEAMAKPGSVDVVVNTRYELRADHLKQFRRRRSDNIHGTWLRHSFRKACSAWSKDAEVCKMLEDWTRDSEKRDLTKMPGFAGGGVTTSTEPGFAIASEM
jgi:hypothetical protein